MGEGKVRAGAGKVAGFLFGTPGLVVGLLAVGFAIGYKASDRDVGRAAAIVPGEYLYLDSDRVDAYLGQMEGGLSPSEERSSTTTAKAEASLNTGGVAAGASHQQDLFVKRVVTPTATDRFVRLYERLRRDFGEQLHEFRPTGPHDELLHADDGVEEGDFVRIRDARLLAPTYVLPLPKLAHAATLLEGDQQEVLRRDVARLAVNRRRETTAYLERLGKDPRVPLVVKALETNDRGERQFTFFVPVRYSKLADSPVLMSGNVTIVGKVVRRVPEPVSGPVESFREDFYGDIETTTAYMPALRRASDPFLRTLQMDTPRLDPREVVLRTATVKPRGMVVIPIAIYS